MLAANVCSADFIAEGKHPGLYRVHEGPTPEKKEILRGYLKAMGVGLSISDDPKPGEFQAIAEATKERPGRAADPHHAAALDAAGDLHADQQRPLRPGLRGLHALHQPDPALSRPAGAPRDQGDPGQDASTSCRCCRRRARRTPSWRKRLAVAREGADQQAARRPPSRRRKEVLAWEAAGLHCSANERRADEASRDVEAWLKCKYMREHLGEEYGGVVTAATTFGIFVTLDAMYVEGLVHITELGGEYFKFDEAAAGAARRAHRHPLRHRHAGAGAGEPRRPGRPQDRLPPGARRRRAGARAP